MADSYGSNGEKKNNNGDFLSWVAVVAGFAIFPPIGMVLLFLKLTGVSLFSGSSAPKRGRHPYDIRQDRAAQGMGQAPSQPGQAASPAGAAAARSPRSGGRTSVQPGMQGVTPQRRRKYVDLKRGKAMTVWGAFLAGLFGFVSVIALPNMLLEEGLFSALANLSPVLGFTGLGLVLLLCGIQRNKKAKRFHRYLALIGKRDSISISSLAQAMSVSRRTACEDLQEMLDEGYIPTGYLDMSSGRLILSDEGLREEEPAQSEPEAEAEGEAEKTDNDILAEIRAVNNSIADPEMSRKIDRIGEITGKILDYQRRSPSKAGQLRSFLNYYLPTTLKILKAYSQMEAQGIEGQNITAAKARIEGMMDKVVEGFEKQLDRLFQDEAMDITTDVEVLERMLDKDGLSDGGATLTMGGGGAASSSLTK